MTTAHHAQSDGLVERSIGTLGEALRTFCGFDATFDSEGLTVDWTTVVHTLEYAYNSSQHKVTGIAPFILERGYIPRGPADVFKDLSGLAAPRVDLLAQEWVETIMLARKRALDAIERAFGLNKARWDAKHREVEYRPGDWAKLSTKHFSFKGVSNKLTPAFIGPFEVTEIVAPNAVRLALRDPWAGRHDVFPVSLLEPHHKPETFEHRRQPPAGPEPLLEDDGREVWEVEKVLSSRKFPGDSEPSYLIRWKGYSPDQDSWEPASGVNNETIERYEQSLGKAKPRKQRAQTRPHVNIKEPAPSRRRGAPTQSQPQANTTEHQLSSPEPSSAPSTLRVLPYRKTAS